MNGGQHIAQLGYAPASCVSAADCTLMANRKWPAAAKTDAFVHRTARPDSPGEVLTG